MSAKKSIPCIFSVLFVIVSMLAITPLQVAQAAGVRYAKPAASGTGDCSSWANACTLQTALTSAISGDEIWVAEGMYKPTAGTDRDATFQLKSGVALYGGFAGTETARSQRSPATNITILSGDIDSNDSQTPIITDIATVTGNTANSYHVVTGAAGATLDGFTVTAGNANGADSYSNGSGGGMFYVADPTLFLTDITFSGNSATSNGGGMYSSTASNSTLVDITFNSNSATRGGGMYNWDNSPTLTNVTFSGNMATHGGGMLNYISWGIPTLTNVTFSGNMASYNGGGMFNDGSNPTLTNVTFGSNFADAGGGMFNNSSSPTLTNITFRQNMARVVGGMFNNDDSNPHIHNTIFWGNTGAQIYNTASSSLVVSDSVVQGGCPSGSICTHIIITDPLLGTLGDYGGSTQTIPLQAGSSAINTGNNAVCPATDQRGVVRPQGVHCDIGSFEYEAPDTISPTAFAITRADANPTNLASVDFTVTFSEFVTGVGVADFTLTTSGISGASVSGVSGLGSVYTVTVSTGTGIGRIRLDVIDNDSIVDRAGNSLGGPGAGNGNFIGGETYNVRFHLIYIPLVLK